SSAKTSRALRRKRTAPSGKRQAPRPSIWPAQRCNRPTTSPRARPLQASPRVPARAARPWTQGPHWPAVSPASQAITRAVSVRPQAPARKDRHGTAAETAAPAAEIVVGQSGRRRGAGVEPEPEVAADEDGGDPVGGARPGQQVGQREPGRHLV